MKTQEKWILLVLLAIVIFVVFLVVCALNAQDFFKDWKVKRIVPTPYGFQATFTNPNPEGIRSVNVALLPDGSVLGWWYFDEEGNPTVWKLTEEGFRRDRDEEAGCIRCHEIKPKVRL